MSLMPYIVREPRQDEVTAAERLIYRRFVSYVESGLGQTRAALRTAKDCGVSRGRVAEIVRKVNTPAY